MKTTYRDLINFAESASRWLTQNSKEPPTKLSYAVARMLKRVQKSITEFNEQIEDLRNDLCLTDERTKAIVQDANGLNQFTKENLKKLIEARRQLLNEEIDIEPYIATELPKHLSDDVRVAFEGFVITEQEHAIS